MEKLIIIGSGPAGLTAAIYAARADLAPLVIAGVLPGGQLMQTTEVENYPGFVDGIMGPELMLQMRKQAERFGARFIDSNVTEVDFSDIANKKIVVGNESFTASSVIIATGATAKWLNVPGENDFKGRGVSSCATCDGAFFRNKVVAVIGGGDSAMEEANFLTRFASTVHIIHRRDQFRASKIMQNRVLENSKINVIFNSAISHIHGNSKVESISLLNTVTNETSQLQLDGIFVAIGHEPNTKFLNGQIELNEQGYIIQNVIHQDNGSSLGVAQTTTNIEGVFVAGDVYDARYKQAITAAGSGCKAALDAEKYLETLHQ